MVFFGYKLDKKPHCQHSVVAPDGTLAQSLDLKLEKPCMMHDFAITAKYVVSAVFSYLI